MSLSLNIVDIHYECIFVIYIFFFVNMNIEIGTSKIYTFFRRQKKYINFFFFFVEYKFKNVDVSILLVNVICDTFNITIYLK